MTTRYFSPWSAAALALLAAFCVANRELVTGRAAPIWDADSQFAPYFTLLADFIRAGRLLLWDPWLNGGSPDFANPEVGALSPVTVAFAAIGGPTISGFRAYWLSLWFLSGAGILVLAKHLGAPV